MVNQINEGKYLIFNKDSHTKTKATDASSQAQAKAVRASQ